MSQARHDRPDPRLLGHAAQLGGLDRALRGARASRCSRPPTPGFEVEVEALNADPSPIEARDRAADHRAPRGRRRRARRAADPHGPLGRRRVHADPARPRLRRRRRGDQLGARPRASSACRCRRSRRRSRCSRTRPTATARSASRTSSGTTRSPTASARRSRRALYERYHIPASGRDLLGQRAGQHPPGQGRQLGQLQERRPRAAAVHLRQRRPPDAAVASSSSNAKHYKSETRSPRSRSSRARTCCPSWPGWEEVADYALDWALEHARGEPAEASGSPTSAGRPSLIEVGGWRLLTDPTFDPPGRQLPLRLGDAASRKLAGPAIAAARARADRRASCSPTTTTTTTSTPPGRALLPSAGVVVTTAAGAERLGGGARGLEPWETTRLEAPRAGRRSRSRRRRAATGRRAAARSSAT